MKISWGGPTFPTRYFEFVIIVSGKFCKCHDSSLSLCEGQTDLNHTGLTYDNKILKS